MRLSCQSLSDVSEGCIQESKARHTGLSGSNDIAVLKDGWNSVRLNGSWVCISAEVDVVDHSWMKTSSLELYESVMRDEKDEKGLASAIGAGRSSASATT